MLILYAVLGALAVVYLFPFYWAVCSSLKSPAGLTMRPPPFFPAEPATATLDLPALGRTFEGQGSRWLRLCAGADPDAAEARAGAFFVRLEGADTPTRLVQWWPDGALTAATGGAERVRFASAPCVRVRGRSAPLVLAARMVRRRGGGSEERLFAVSGSSGRIEMLVNPRYAEQRRFAPRWRNYPETLRGPERSFGAETRAGFLLFMRNSLLISALAVLGQLLSSSLVAFGFARLDFKGRDALFVLLLATLMVPGQVTLIPLFAVYKELGWIDTFLPLIVPHFTAGAFNVFLLRQYMLTLPRELDESAAIDGCGPLRIWRSILMPNCVPALIVVAIFTFVHTWQDVMGPLIYLDNPAYRTVTLGLEFFRSPYVDNRHLLMAGAVLAMAPVALLFLVLQRHIMAGIATTGLKG